MKGYIALTTLLVILPLLLLTGIDSVYKNLTSLSVGKMNYDYQLLKTNEETCLEESVYKIKRSADYTGDITLTFDTWSCLATVSNKVGDPGIKVIDMELSDDSDIKFNLSKELNTNTNPFELTNI